MKRWINEFKRFKLKNLSCKLLSHKMKKHSSLDLFPKHAMIITIKMNTTRMIIPKTEKTIKRQKYIAKT